MIWQSWVPGWIFVTSYAQLFCMLKTLQNDNANSYQYNIIDCVPGIQVMTLYKSYNLINILVIY